MFLACVGILGAAFVVSTEAFAERRRCSSCMTQPSLQNLGARRGSPSFSTFRNGSIASNSSVNGVNSRFRNRLREVQGFSNLLTDGKVLFERALVPQGRVRVEVVRQLFIGQVGRDRGVLLNSTDPATRVQVRDLFLKNFQNFRGNAQRLALDYLNANGAGDALVGNLRVAIKGGLLPPGVTISDPKYKGIPPEKVNAAALSFAINLISNARNPLPITPGNMFPDGTIRMNLTGAVDPAGLARLLNDNPYDCDRRGVARVDWLVTKALDPDIYYQLTDLSANQDEFADQVGFVDEKKFQRGSLMLVAGSRTKPESIVGRHPQRILQFQERQNSRGRLCFRSHDFTQDPIPGTEEASRDVFRAGVNFTADAGEWICQRANGFPIYYLSDEKNRNRANNAPAEIALDGGNRVGVAEKCIKCHINGFHGGRLQNIGQGDAAKPYTDHFARINPALGQEFFSANSVYRNFNESANFNEQPVGRNYPAAAIAASNIQQQAMRASGAYLEDPTWRDEAKRNPFVKQRPLPVVVDMAAEYRKDLTVERQAQELGTSVDTVLALQAQQAGLGLAAYKGKWPQGQLVSRNEFANSYCRRKDAVRGGRFQPNQRNVAAETAHTPGAPVVDNGGAVDNVVESPTRPPAPPANQ